jgi:hypothetical protein
LTAVMMKVDLAAAPSAIIAERPGRVFPCPTC